MTALREYDRLEATALWRPGPQDQRREVVVSIGEATLIITDTRDRALTHWSLAALERQNPGERPAIFSPDGDTGETLEIGPDEGEMIDAIEKLRRAVERSRPHPGRLRQVSILAISGLFLALTVFWLPGAMLRHTLDVVPDIKRQEIGAAVLGRIERLSGKACNTPEAQAGLNRLARRTGVRKVVILRTGVKDSLLLPGQIVLLNRALVEDHEDPAVAAGFILMETARAQADDPLARLLRASGLTAPLRLLTTGSLTPQMLDRYSETVLLSPKPDPEDDRALAAFAEAGVSSVPFAYARDITGESVLGLIEADPMAGQDPDPIMADRDWILLQNICGG